MDKTLVRRNTRLGGLEVRLYKQWLSLGISVGWGDKPRGIFLTLLFLDLGWFKDGFKD